MEFMVGVEGLFWFVKEMKVMASLEMMMKMKLVLCFGFSTSLHLFLNFSLKSVFFFLSQKLFKASLFPFLSLKLLPLNGKFFLYL